MTYVPPATISQTFTANDADWGVILDNHAEVQETYTPAILDQYLSFTVTATAYATRVVWKVRTNAALHKIRVRVRARKTVGAGTLRAFSDANTATAAVTGVWAWYVIEVTPTAADSSCGLEAKVTTIGDSLEVGAIQVYLEPDPGNDVTGWVPVAPAVWGVADKQVPVRVVEDVMNGVVYVARDRPFCLTSRVSDLTIAVSGKTASAFGASNTAAWTPVGRLLMPHPMLGAGSGRIDAYVTRSAGTASVTISVGAFSWAFSAAADGWYTTTLSLPTDNSSDVNVSLIPGVGQSAAVRSLQVWRGGV